MQIKKLKLYQIVEATCSDIVSEGLGLCHIDSSEYKPLTGFVLGVMPGESFLAKVTRVKSNHFHGVILPVSELNSEKEPNTWIGKKHSPGDISHDHWAIFNPSPLRKKPDCPNFTYCGSCKMLHMDYSQTLVFKKKWLGTQLDRNHITYPEIHVNESPRKYKYRNHVQIHINKHKERGFYAPYSYTTKKFPDSGCLIFDQNMVDRIFPPELELERCVRARLDYNRDVTGIWSLYSPTEKKEKFTYNIQFPKESATDITITNESFFQTNSSIIPDWLGDIHDLISSENIEGPIRLLELFSGFGFISNMLSMKLPILSLGIDILTKKSLQEISIQNQTYETAFHFFKENYIQHDLNLLDRLKADEQERITRFEPNLVLINPPRSGFLPSQIGFLMNQLLKDYNGSIIYSSCNGATFARDSAEFQNFGYAIKNIDLLDFFPWTSHYEVLAKFSRNIQKGT